MFFLGTKNALDFTLAKNTSLQSRPPCWPRQGRGLSQQLVLHPLRWPHRAVSHEGSKSCRRSETRHHRDGEEDGRDGGWIFNFV